LSGAYPLLNAMSYDGEILHADTCRPCAGRAGLMTIGVAVTKIISFLYKCVHVGLQFCCGDLMGPGNGLVGGTVWPIPAGRLAGCSSRPIYKQ